MTPHATRWTHAMPQPMVIADREEDDRKDGPCLKVLLIGDVFEESQHGYGGSADH